MCTAYQGRAVTAVNAVFTYSATPRSAAGNGHARAGSSTRVTHVIAAPTFAEDEHGRGRKSVREDRRGDDAERASERRLRQRLTRARRARATSRRTRTLGYRFRGIRRAPRARVRDDRHDTKARETHRFRCTQNEFHADRLSVLANDVLIRGRTRWTPA